MNKPSTILIIGPSGCGETCALLYEIIEKEHRKEFDYILIIRPTTWINKTYNQWKYLTDIDKIGLEISSDKLNLILKHIIDIYSGLRTAVIIGDMSDSTEQHHGHNMLSYLGYSGRHHNFSLFILSQKLNSISAGMRQYNQDYIL